MAPWGRGTGGRSAAEYAEYVVIVALVTVALAVGLHLLQPFAAHALDGVMDNIANSL